MRRPAVGLAIIALTQSACSDQSVEGISVVSAKDHYAVTIRSKQLRGLCYAPESFRPNGSLVLADLPAGKQVLVRRVAADKIDGLDQILGYPRDRIPHDTVTVNFPTENVLQRPTYLQLPIFDCRADAANPAPDKNLFLLSAKVDLR